MPKENKIKDIENLEDVKIVVDAFYSQVQKDDLIGIIFEKQIQDRWPVHLEKMYQFWETILLSKSTYTGKPFPPHAVLPLDKKHFERWLQIFESTIDSHFSGLKADEAKWRAHRMAEMFLKKIQYMQQNPDKPLLI